MSVLEQEQARYNEIKNYLDEKINALEESVKIQADLYDSNNKNESEAKKARIDKFKKDIEMLTSRKNIPFIGKIVFKNSDGEEETIYIGKNKIINNSNDALVYDWKSDICSLFYDYDLGNASYIENKETRTGTILEKKKFVYNGNTISLTDSFPIHYPSYSKISSSQNKVIRNNINHNTLVIGESNTGKTTTLINRISYLLDRDIDAKVMLLGKDSKYLNNIENEIDENANRVTLNNINKVALDSFKSKGKPKEVIDDKYQDIKDYKSSFEYLEAINKFVDDYIISNLQEPIVYKGVELFDVRKLSSIYSKTMMLNSSYAERVKMRSKFFIQDVKSKSDYISEKVYVKNYKEKMVSLKLDNPERKEIVKLKVESDKEVKNGCVNVINSYFDFIKTSPIILYSKFISNIDKYDPNFKLDKSKLMESILNNRYSSLDLAAIMYINCLVNGISNQENYTHIFVDNTEDISELFLFIIKKMYPKAIFNIFGSRESKVFSDTKFDRFELTEKFDKKEMKNIEIIEEVKVEPKIEKKEEFKPVDIVIEKPKEKFEPVEIVIEQEEVKEETKEITLLPVQMFAVKGTKIIVIDDAKLLDAGDYKVNIELFDKLIKNKDENQFIYSSEIKKLIKA